MKILITGGTGFIGASICATLLKAYPATDITVLDDMRRGHNELYVRQLQPNIKIIEKTLESLHPRELAHHKFDAVIHCAANAYVGESYDKPNLYLHTNVQATLQLLNALDLETLQTFIFSSTCAVYGSSTEIVTEETPLNPESPYAWSKIISENIITSYAARYDFQATIFRYFNVAGAIPGNDIGERHDPETHLIPVMFESYSQKKPFQLFGTDYNTIDGSCAREYVHIWDLVNAHLLALTNKDLYGTTVINLCTGVPITNLQLIEVANEVWKCTLQYELKERRGGDAAELTGSGQKGEHLLGWKPQRSKITDILSDYKIWKETLS